MINRAWRGVKLKICRQLGRHQGNTKEIFFSKTNDRSRRSIFKFDRSQQCHILEINLSREGRILTMHNESHIDTKYGQIVSNLGRDTPANSNRVVS